MAIERMYRFRNGQTSPEPMLASDAIPTHRKGDRYKEEPGPTTTWFRLHRSMSLSAPRPHFEFEPRWFTGRIKAGIEQR